MEYGIVFIMEFFGDGGNGKRFILENDAIVHEMNLRHLFSDKGYFTKPVD